VARGRARPDHGPPGEARPVGSDDLRRVREWLEEQARSAKPRAVLARPPDRRQLLAQAGVPERLRGVTLASLQTPMDAELRAAMREVAAYVRGMPDNVMAGAGLLFSGLTGRGKTTLAVAALGEALACGLSGAFVTATGLIERLDEPHNEHRTGYVHRILGVRLLVLDDLGAEAASDRNRARIDWLATERHNSGRALIVTTNLSPRDLAARYSDRVASRWAEACRTVVLAKGPDLRLSRKEVPGNA
jgi:DNA replication protein DnaC